MVTKLFTEQIFSFISLILAKIYMVTKLTSLVPLYGWQSYSSKNLYGNKTLDSFKSPTRPSYSSKNLYGNKTY